MLIGYTGFVQHTAHVYNAALLEGHLALTWADVDHMTAIQKTADIYIGDFPYHWASTF